MTIPNEHFTFNEVIPSTQLKARHFYSFFNTYPDYFIVGQSERIFCAWTNLHQFSFDSGKVRTFLKEGSLVFNPNHNSRVVTTLTLERPGGVKWTPP